MRLDLIRPPRLGLLDLRVGRSAASCDIRIGSRKPHVCHQRRLCCGRSVLILRLKAARNALPFRPLAGLAKFKNPKAFGRRKRIGGGGGDRLLFGVCLCSVQYQRSAFEGYAKLSQCPDVQRSRLLLT
jgi:hypothetical protein